MKLLVRSHALCDDASPPPLDDNHATTSSGTSATVNVASLSPSTYTVSSLSPVRKSSHILFIFII